MQLSLQRAIELIDKVSVPFPGFTQLQPTTYLFLLELYGVSVPFPGFTQLQRKEHGRDVHGDSVSVPFPGFTQLQHDRACLPWVNACIVSVPFPGFTQLQLLLLPG